MRILQQTAFGLMMLIGATGAVNAEETGMKPDRAIELVTLHSNNFPAMKAFFMDSVGLDISYEQDEFVAFNSTPVNFAIVSRSSMFDTLKDEGFRDQRGSGSAIGLGFYFDTDAKVDTAYATLLEKGGRGISAPKRMPWGEYIGFFADPDGNIHEFVSREKHGE